MTNYLIQKLLVLPGVLIGISVHEFAHSYAALKLGDNSQRIQGRLTLDPTKHIDPIGFLLLLLLGFGWAKPVIIDSRAFKNPRRDDTIVSLAGPFMNLLTAIIFTVVLGIVYYFSCKAGDFSKISTIILNLVQNVIFVNLVLMVFNLIPIPPLDGYHVLGNIFGARVWNFYFKYADILRFVLLGMILFNITGFILSPIVEGIYNILFNLMAKVVGSIL